MAGRSAPGQRHLGSILVLAIAAACAWGGIEAYRRHRDLTVSEAVEAARRTDEARRDRQASGVRLNALLDDMAARVQATPARPVGTARLPAVEAPHRAITSARRSRVVPAPEPAPPSRPRPGKPIIGDGPLDGVPL